MFGTAATGGMPLLFPAMIVGTLAAVSALGMHKRGIARELGLKSRKLDDNNPLLDKTRNIAGRIGIDAPDVYLRHPGYNDYNAASWSENFPKKEALIILSGMLFTSSYPGRPPVLDEDEQEAIIAHELLHIKRRDSSHFMLERHIGAATTVCAVLAILGAASGALPATAAMTALSLKVAGTLAGFAHKRQTERAVDEGVVKLTGKPDAYASALAKTRKGNAKALEFYKNAKDITSSVDNEQFQWVAFRQTQERTLQYETFAELTLLHTHPPIEERINNIYETAGYTGAAYDKPSRIPANDDDNAANKAPRTPEGIILPPCTEHYRILRTRDNDNLVIALTSISISDEFNKCALGQGMNENLRNAFEVVAQRTLDDAEYQLRQNKKTGKLLP